MAGQTLCRPCRAEVFLLGAVMECGRVVTASREVRANVQNLSRSDKPRVAVRLKPTEPVVDKRCVAPATLELLRIQQASLRDAIAFLPAARALKRTATVGTSLRDVSGVSDTNPQVRKVIVQTTAAAWKGCPASP